MSLWILQMSDMHFGQTNPPLASSRALSPLVDAVRNELALKHAPLVVAICGDVVDAGNQAYYDTAAQTLEDELLKPLGWPPVVCCPGNHDVVAGENGDFTAFNRFVFRITQKANLVFSRSATVTRREVLGFEFFSANSMYRGHLDRQRGEVNIDAFDRITSPTVSLPRVLVVHHSLIPNDQSDTSTLVNSYPLLQLAVGRGFVGILHGHLHVQNVLFVGREAKTAVLGVGSLLFRPWPNYNNGFNLIRYEGTALSTVLSFRFIADAAAGGMVGTFQKTDVGLI